MCWCRCACGWLALCAFLVTGCESEQPMVPEPIQAGDVERMENLPQLRPHIRNLLIEMKSGGLVGANASRFRDDLDMADKLSDNGSLTTYVFFGVPETAGKEGSPFLAISVQKRFDLIVRCTVVVPVY